MDTCAKLRFAITLNFKVMISKDNPMKKTAIFATILCFGSMPAMAGSLGSAEAEATVQPPMVPVVGRSGGNTGVIAAGAGLLALAALAASSSSSSSTTTTE
jgi:hypothetical protein